jgi:hypothetical protein
MRKRFVMMALIALAQSEATPLFAHSWYPHECCHDGDCAPADNVVRLAPTIRNASYFRVTSKFGTVDVPASFPTRDSPDGRMHICMNYGPFGSLEILCVFVPPGM